MLLFYLQEVSEKKVEKRKSLVENSTHVSTLKLLEAKFRDMKAGTEEQHPAAEASAALADVDVSDIRAPTKDNEDAHAGTIHTGC